MSVAPLIPNTEVNGKSGQDWFLTNLAATYRRRGYQVVIKPVKDQIPTFLASFHPDLLALSQEDSVVVEIASPEKSEKEYWQRLTDAMKGHSNWRVDLYSREPDEDGENMSISHIQTRLSESKEWLAEGKIEPAFLVAWPATEAAMRQIADKYHVERSDIGTGTLITRLYSDGFMEQEDYHLLRDLLKKRNAVVHGFRETILPEDVTNLLAVASRVLAE